jgi:hypothetical protein
MPNEKKKRPKPANIPQIPPEARMAMRPEFELKDPLDVAMLRALAAEHQAEYVTTEAMKMQLDYAHRDLTKAAKELSNFGAACSSKYGRKLRYDQSSKTFRDFGPLEDEPKKERTGPAESSEDLEEKKPAHPDGVGGGS